MVQDNSEYRRLYDALLHHFKGLKSQDKELATMDPFYAINFVLRHVAAEWLYFSHVVEFELVNFDFIWERNRDLPFNTLQNQLFALRIWRRRFTMYVQFLEQSVLMSRERGPKSWKKTYTGELAGDLCAKSFEEVLQKFKVLKDHTEREVNLIVGMISSQMGKLSVKEAILARRLMIVALMFLPLSLVASWFSMSGRFALDGKWGWIYWAVAVPLTASVMFVGLYHWK